MVRSDGAHAGDEADVGAALIEEFARHAGHADLVREQLDGALAGQLTMAVHDIPGNDFIQPWERAAG